MDQPNDSRKLLNLLSLASDELGSSLSYDETILHACSVPVPLLSNWSALFIMDEALATLSFEKSFHHNKNQQTSLQNYFETRGDLFTRRAAVIHSLKHGEPVQEETENDPDIGTHLLHIPLLHQSEVVGFITLGSEKAFTGEDIQIGAEVLHRAASAIVNARLYQNVLNSEAKQVTAAKTAEGANSAKSEFLANMSHEIRTPISAILGFADLLMQPNQTEQERLEWGQRIKHNGQHLLRLINDILNLSKVESGEVTLENSVISFTRFLDDLELTLSAQARLKKLELTFNIESPVPTEFITDATRLRQILTNVIGNALKFTEKGSVQVQAGFLKKTGHLYFDVKDTGPGLTQKQASQLFRPFVQADTEHAKKFGGTGLGLALSIKLARLLGGDLELVNSAPDQGSHFRITIKPKLLQKTKYISQPDSQLALSEKAEARNDAEQLLKNVRILLVDDSPDNQYLMKTLLTRKGADVEVASCGNEALQKSLSEKHDIILMDIQMPGKDGYQVTRELRARGLKTPVVAFTAYALPEERDKSLQAGCNAHITKPVNQCELMQVLQDMLNPKQ